MLNFVINQEDKKHVKGLIEKMIKFEYNFKNDRRIIKKDKLFLEKLSFTKKLIIFLSKR